MRPALFFPDYLSIYLAHDDIDLTVFAVFLRLFSG
jgi:hypothetical protein